MDKAGDPSARAQAWLASYSRSSRWLEKWDLPRLLDEHGGLVKIPAFFPDHVAEEALRIVAAIPARLWVPTEAEHDAAANNIRHSFASTKRSGPGLDALFRVLTLLLPGQLHALSAARYAAADGIAPHDDRAFTPVQMDSGAVVSCSRDVAVIYYLTKGWEERMGGVLVDLETGAPPCQPPATAQKKKQKTRVPEGTSQKGKKPMCCRVQVRDTSQSSTPWWPSGCRACTRSPPWRRRARATRSSAGSSSRGSCTSWAAAPRPK